MQEQTNTAQTHPTSAGLQGLLALGYVEGPPPHLPAEVLEIDRQVATQLRCPQCRRRGMSFTALHRGQQYACVASCPRCHAEEEL